MADQQQQQQLGAPPSQQQQNQPPQQHGNVLTPAAQGGNGDSTVSCQWQGCGLRFPTAELVYDHLCEQHIGRKSTNNLNLTCAWSTCHIHLQKRDHMTSHVRVHVPLKPHHCSFCGKSFKRPQDLKKHVKTHADDNVPRPPMNNAGNVQHPNGAYNAGPQNRMPNYYGGNPMQPNGAPMGYGQQNNANNGSSAYYAPTQQANQPAYGYVNYDVNQSSEVGNQASFGSRKRGYDAIDSFLGDAKRGRINFSDYASMSSRLSGLQGIQPPMPTYGSVGTLAGESYANYQATPVMMDVGGNGGVYGPTSQHAYSLPPMTNLRTKNDLLETQDVIGRIMTSLYEHPNITASAGVPTNGNYTYNSVADRQSHSPPGIQLPSSHNGSISSAPDMTTTGSNHSNTPALTPSSYHSGTSPVSMHSNHSMSPHSTAAMYPTLPTTASTSEASGYMTSNMAPSTLGNQFDYDNRQRYGGGRLHKAAPAPRSINEKINSSEDHVATAKKALSTSSDETETPKSEGRPLSRMSNSAIDPALSGLASPSATSESETVADKAQEVWVENVRLMEFLKKVVDRMLEEGEYEGGDAEKAERREEENASLYPTLREMAVSE